MVEDMTGQKHGLLLVYEKAPSKGAGARWRCLCDCGTYMVARGARLRSGRTVSCGCKSLAKLAGKRFGRLIAVERENRSDKGNGAAWRCKCDCGNITSIPSGRLNSGNTKSCGCLRTKRQYEALYNNFVVKATRYSSNKFKGPEQMEVTITYEEFVTFTTSYECSYCVAPVEWVARGLDGRHARYNLDRKDNKRGYHLDNVVVCCTRCNMGKGNRYTHEEWFGMTAYFRQIRKGQAGNVN